MEKCEAQEPESFHIIWGKSREHKDEASVGVRLGLKSQLQVLLAHVSLQEKPLCLQWLAEPPAAAPLNGL
jgi:hypothetical protein